MNSPSDWLDGALRDARHAMQLLRARPGASAIAVLSLALGIGINTTVFTAYRAFVKRPLDARAPQELVNVALSRGSGPADYLFSYPDYETYRDAVGGFSGLAAFRVARVALAGAGPNAGQPPSASAIGRLGLLGPSADTVEFAQSFVVSENYFHVLGVLPSRGQAFDTSAADAPATALVSDNYWQLRFARDPGLIGRSVQLNGTPVVVVGVMPRDFTGTGISAPAFWLPARLEPQINGKPDWLRDRENRPYRLVGRLAPGETIARVRAQATPIADQLRSLHDPAADAARPASVLMWPGSPFPLPIDQYGGLTLTIFLLMAGAVMVLVVASANVSSLQVARARSRDAELRMRMALGATRARLVRQLLTEQVVTGLVAGGIALAMSWALLKIAVYVFTAALPVGFGSLVFDVAPDAGVFAYGLLLSLAAGVLSGLTPALQSPRTGLVAPGRGGTATRRGRRMQDVLLTVQVALSLILIIVSSLFVRGAIHSLEIPTGYDSGHVVAVTVQFPNASDAGADRRVARMNDLRAHLAALPGVTMTTSAQPPGTSLRTSAAVIDNITGKQAEAAILFYTYAEPEYFATLGIPLRRGRTLDRAGDGTPSILLSESAARQLFQHADPLGQLVRLGPIDERPHDRSALVPDGRAYEVVGVVGDTRGSQFDRSDSQQVYLPLPADRVGTRPLLLCVPSAPGPVLTAVDRVAAAISPGMVVSSFTLEDALRQSPPFLNSVLAAGMAAVLGSLGLVLALTGVFGTVSYIVSIRTREVGIRMAIGARRLDVLRLILGESTRPVLRGLATGVLLTVVVVGVLRTAFYGLAAGDVIYVGLVAALFLVVALLASYAPLRRATRVDPMVALRHE